MTYAEIAEEVLRRKNAPLSAKKITEEAIKMGLLRPEGKTPVASMTAAIYASMIRHGQNSPFRSKRRGKYELGPRKQHS